MENYIKFEEINLKNHPEINEKWIQNKITEDPSVLGLGEVIVKDAEKIQITGGRLDLLLYDQENNTRYEVELQLGRTDETHIIRTIEYWDIERKRNPQYEHCAVIIAEDVTSRFLNVISLFNGSIPLIALQMKGIKVGNNFSLVFTKILDILEYELDEEDIPQELTDRVYWERKSSKEQLQLCDQIMILINSIQSGYELKYNKHYIGLSKDGISRNFISFTPKKNYLIISFKHQTNKDFDEILDSNGFDVMSYDKQWRLYRIRAKSSDLNERKDALLDLIRKSYNEYNS